MTSDHDTQWSELIDLCHRMLRKLGKVQRKIDKLERKIDHEMDERRKMQNIEDDYGMPVSRIQTRG